MRRVLPVQAEECRTMKAHVYIILSTHTDGSTRYFCPECRREVVLYTSPYTYLNTIVRGNIHTPHRLPHHTRLGVDGPPMPINPYEVLQPELLAVWERYINDLC